MKQVKFSKNQLNKLAFCYFLFNNNKKLLVIKNCNNNNSNKIILIQIKLYYIINILVLF